MIDRLLLHKLEELMPDFPAIAILGPRQVGKTTLAQTIAEHFDHQSFTSIWKVHPIEPN